MTDTVVDYPDGTPPSGERMAAGGTPTGVRKMMTDDLGLSFRRRPWTTTQRPAEDLSAPQPRQPAPDPR